MKSIYIFTNTFPYGKFEENFLCAELEIASTLDLDISLVPLWRKNSKRDIPIGINVINNLADRGLRNKVTVFFKMVFNRLFWEIPFQKKTAPSNIRSYYQAVKYLYGGILIDNFLKSYSAKFNNESVFYSYWFNHTALGFALARKRMNLKRAYFITRAHGFDLYEEKVKMYFPYREFTIANIDKVYSVSERGKDFLSKKYPDYPSKIGMSRLGIIPINMTGKTINQAPMEYNFISCSSVIPLKRVNLIFSSLLRLVQAIPNMSITWTHIGAGAKFKDLEILINENKNERMIVELKGLMSNNVVREILGSGKFDCFINLSTTEGIPVSIMESISAGIPVIATNVGGVREIVTTATGILLNVDFSQDDFAEGIKQIILRKKELSITANNYFKENFEARTNFNAFYQAILSL